MSEYIERDAVKDMLKRECSPRVMAYLVDELCEIPAADVRPVGLLEQVEWERDTAFAQLAEIGKSFGEKMDDVRPVVFCKDCKWWTKQESSLQGRCELFQMYPTGAWFCANGKREES